MQNGGIEEFAGNLKAYQHSKCSTVRTEGENRPVRRQATLAQKRNKNPPREEDVALIFIRGRRARGRGPVEVGKGECESVDEMKCKCLNEPLRNCRSTFQLEAGSSSVTESLPLHFLINDLVTEYHWSLPKFLK